ncbi:MAG TPA: RDD family protein [Casimicrobiaceae bacterium]|nr:RDD family protein [Casimicrobiaceae bacterium]
MTADARRPATIRRRIAALAYEALLLTAMAFVAGFVFLPFLPHDPTRQTLAVPSPFARAVMFCALAAAAGFYYVWCWSDGRRTLPQKTWRLRLLDRGGAPPTRARALVRYVACWIGPALALAAYALLGPRGHAANAAAFIALGYCWAVVDRDRQFLHDRIAGTWLVQDARSDGKR